MLTLIRFAVIIVLVVSFSADCSLFTTPTPVQFECVKYTNCGACVMSGCGWCGGDSQPARACYSFKSESMQCAEPVGFVQSCTDGSAPFPDVVINPIPYGPGRRLMDGGVAPSPPNDRPVEK